MINKLIFAGILGFASLFSAPAFANDPPPPEKLSAYQQLADSANAVLEKAIQAATSTGEFLEEQVPLVVEELVAWKIAEAVIYVLLCVAFFVIWVWRGWVFCNKKDPNSVDFFPWGPWLIVAGFGSFFAIPAFIINLMVAVKWIVAPRVALIEYAANLVR